MSKKKVVVQLPAVAKEIPLEERYALELESLKDIADLIEVDSSSPEAFAEGAKDADGIITSWGIRIDENVIAGLEKCAVVGIGSVGVDMVDVDAATEAGIVVTNTPDIFIEEVADHTLMLILACARRAGERQHTAEIGEHRLGDLNFVAVGIAKIGDGVAHSMTPAGLVGREAAMMPQIASATKPTSVQPGSERPRKLASMMAQLPSPASTVWITSQAGMMSSM